MKFPKRITALVLCAAMCGCYSAPAETEAQTAAVTTTTAAATTITTTVTTTTTTAATTTAATMTAATAAAEETTTAEKTTASSAATAAGTEVLENGDTVVLIGEALDESELQDYVIDRRFPHSDKLLDALKDLPDEAKEVYSDAFYFIDSFWYTDSLVEVRADTPKIKVYSEPSGELRRVYYQTKISYDSYYKTMTDIFTENAVFDMLKENESIYQYNGGLWADSGLWDGTSHINIEYKIVERTDTDIDLLRIKYYPKDWLSWWDEEKGDFKEYDPETPDLYVMEYDHYRLTMTENGWRAEAFYDVY